MTNNSFEKSFRAFFGIKLTDETREIIIKIVDFLLYLKFITLKFF